MHGQEYIRKDISRASPAFTRPDTASLCQRRPGRQSHARRRALVDQPTIIVLDNCESVLPERGNPTDPSDPSDPSDSSTAIFALCQSLLEASRHTRLLFTTREPLPAPFDHPGRKRELGALDRNDAIELVSEVTK